LIDQYEYNTRRGPFYEEVSSLNPEGVVNPPVRYIAYYLPQFHTSDVNDAAWGVGFTEWTNTSKALPRYLGHYQPRLPGDLGYYNLEDVNTIKRQVEFAKRGGIFGFCVHYYWFSGKRVLSKPLSLLLKHPEIDFPFCINWANESWTRTWDGSEQTIILKQEYRREDPQLFAEALVELMQDRRYIRINGRPLIMLYRPGIVPEVARVIEFWRNFLVKAGLGNPYIVMPQAFGAEDPQSFGFDAAAGFPPHKFGFTLPNERWSIRLLDPRFAGVAVSYDKMVMRALAYRPTSFKYFPAVTPNFDNEARKPKRGFSLYGSTPEKYGEWLRAASEQALESPSPDESIVFINAWNEWAEGAYLEPDRHYGFAYLAETRRILDSFGSVERQFLRSNQKQIEDRFITRPRFRHRIANYYFALQRRIRND
jgi:lipopolysaccharide biosynthesis protein